MAATATAPETTSKTSKSKWEIILTTTPVGLTLIATVLAGLSSSEMTLAQYNRSLAAQHQSKAGDQWAFFQAKKMRGVLVGKAVELVGTLPGPVDGKAVSATADRLAEEIKLGNEEVDRLIGTAGKLPKEMADARDRFRQTAERSHDQGLRVFQKARLAADLLRPALADKDVVQALEYLGGDRLPAVKETPISDPAIQDSLAGVRDRLTDKDLAPLVAKVDPAALEEAIRTAQEDAKRFDDAVKKIDKSLEVVDQAAKAQMAAAQQFRRLSEDVQWSAAELPANVSTEPINSGVAAVGRHERAVHRLAEKLQEYRAAHDDFTSRRQEKEARYNQQLAGLLEVQVHGNGYVSDRHQRRSKNFFYTMLCAQAGVAISSLALAARQRSTLWGLASAAGLTALVTGVYIYLRM